MMTTSFLREREQALANHICINQTTEVGLRWILDSSQPRPCQTRSFLPSRVYYDRCLLELGSFHVHAKRSAWNQWQGVWPATNPVAPNTGRTTRHRGGIERCGCADRCAGPAHRQEARPQTGRHAAAPHRPKTPPRIPRRVRVEAVGA